METHVVSKKQLFFLQNLHKSIGPNAYFRELSNFFRNHRLFHISCHRSAATSQLSAEGRLSAESFLCAKQAKLGKNWPRVFLRKASKKTCWEFFCDIQKIPGIQKMGMTMPHQWICTYLVFRGWWMAERDDFKRGYWSPVEIPTRTQIYFLLIFVYKLISTNSYMLLRLYQLVHFYVIFVPIRTFFKQIV